MGVTGEARQEEAFMDDSGLGNIVRPFAGVRERDRARVRLAWGSWLRGFAIGAVIGWIIGATVALLWVRHEWQRATDKWSWRSE